LGTKTKAASDISNMAQACQQFKNKYGFYPPSTFTFPAGPTHLSVAVFKDMFPRWTPTAVAPPTGFPPTITGSQCLVYFLGGPLGTGWAVDAPVAPSPTATAKNTFMDFPVARVVNGAYLDPWKTPYAYFGSGTGGIYPTFQINPTNSPYYTAANFIPAPMPGIAPFFSGAKPVNPNGVQIISAGENMTFGPGGAWTPGAGAYSNAQAPGGDDMANFNGGLMLGVLNN